MRRTGRPNGLTLNSTLNQTEAPMQNLHILCPAIILACPTSRLCCGSCHVATLCRCGAWLRICQAHQVTNSRSSLGRSPAPHACCACCACRGAARACCADREVPPAARHGHPRPAGPPPGDHAPRHHIHRDPRQGATPAVICPCCSTYRHPKDTPGGLTSRALLLQKLSRPPTCQVMPKLHSASCVRVDL